jgi:hypothetical protein
LESVGYIWLYLDIFTVGILVPIEISLDQYLTVVVFKGMNKNCETAPAQAEACLEND